MLATLLVSGLVSRLCLAGLELELVLPEHVSARRNLAARLVLRNLKRWMPSFLHPRSPGFPRMAGHPFCSALSTFLSSLAVPCSMSRRPCFSLAAARIPANLFAFSTKFPFGFLEKTASVTLRKDTIVYPSLEPRPGFEELLADISGEIAIDLRGGGRDFYRIRPYQAFESARHVDWKSTAHTGGLQIREFARERQRTVEMFLDRNVSPAGEEWFERAVECSAFLCWGLQEVGLHFRSQKCDIRIPEAGRYLYYSKVSGFGRAP